MFPPYDVFLSRGLQHEGAFSGDYDSLIMMNNAVTDAFIARVPL